MPAPIRWPGRRLFGYPQSSVGRTAPAHLGERAGDVGLLRVEAQRLAEGGGRSRSIPDGETRQAQPVQHHRGSGAGLERSLEVG